MRKRLSVALMALVGGLVGGRSPGEAASYGGAASTRCCPVPQECGGHVEYQLQRQTCLQNGFGDRLRAAARHRERNVCETIMVPRTVTCAARPSPST